MRFGGDTELHAPVSEVTFQERLHCTDFGALVSLLGTQRGGDDCLARNSCCSLY